MSGCGFFMWRKQEWVELGWFAALERSKVDEQNLVVTVELAKERYDEAVINVSLRQTLSSLKTNLEKKDPAKLAVETVLSVLKMILVEVGSADTSLVERAHSSVEKA